LGYRQRMSKCAWSGKEVPTPAKSTLGITGQSRRVVPAEQRSERGSFREGPGADNFVTVFYVCLTAGNGREARLWVCETDIRLIREEGMR
jgi:hypothetical protein